MANNLISFQKMLKTQQGKMAEMIRNALPKKVGVKLVSFYKANFRKGGFEDGGFKAWKMAQRQLYGSLYTKKASGKYKPLSSQRMRLYNSIREIPRPGSVSIRSSLKYSNIHNEGGETHPRVTKKMRGFMWYMYYQALGISGKTSAKTKKRKLQLSNPLAEKYKAIALTKKERLTVKIDQRKYIYDSPEVRAVVKAELTKEVKRLLKIK